MTEITMSGQGRRNVWTSTRMAVRWTALTFAIVILFGTRPAEIARTARAQEPKQPGAEALKTIATDYVGLTKCATCHFDQYEDWKTSAHGKAFDILPTKYRQDAECLKCHTTGYGHSTGFNKDSSNTSLAGISCEACHGPGGEHAKNALRLVDEGITEEGLKRLRSSIQRLAMEQCVTCHISKAHKMHPPFDRDDSVTGEGAAATRSKSLFSFTAHEE